jgi:hypothetical protein
MLAVVAIVTVAADCSSGSSATEAASASGGGEVVRMWIGPELVECEGVAPMECMQVAEVASPQADGSSLNYSLVEAVSEAPGQ